MLDPIADKLLVNALLIVLAFTGDFDAWDLIPAVAIMLRETLVPGLREYLGNARVEVPVTLLAKWKTTTQLIALAVVILAGLIPGLGLVADLVLWLAAALTVITGAQYFRQRLAPPLGARTMKVRYFAWLRERLNRDEEEVDPPADVLTVADLIQWLRSRDEAADLALQKSKIINAAIDAKMVKHDRAHRRRQGHRADAADDGRLMTVRVETAPFDPGAETNRFLAETAGAGAAVTFTGLVRSNADDPVATLTLECYPELALNQIDEHRRASR